MDFESKDPENEVIKPTINGVLSIMKACAKAETVRRLVFTSSAGTIDVAEHQKPFYDETCWSGLAFIQAKKMTGWMYVVSKTMAEQAAWKFAKENNIDFNFDSWPDETIVISFKDVDESLKSVEFSSKKLTDLGFKFKCSLEDMFTGAVETCREKGLLPLSNEKKIDIK
ncbi:3-beta hydroxysteroid dehydrogenase/isomerase - like 5 [Theobroma cacao]|nr:3-beta hydroxysteroid dehydrogenase/isomerase - like 5 [Theobroma cacao]